MSADVGGKREGGIERIADQRGGSIAYHAQIDIAYGSVRITERIMLSRNDQVLRDPAIIRNISNPRSLYDPENSSTVDYSN